MRVLLTHRFFWPDTPPYALMLRRIGEALAEAGHDVHVFSSVPSYRPGTAAPRRERLGALAVRRCFAFQDEKGSGLRRMANVALYCIALFAEVLRLRPDVVSVSTYPPVIAAWAASLAARLCGARLIYHVQDIHPEISRLSGGRLGRGTLFRLLRRLDRQTCRRADPVVTLSRDMADTLRARGDRDLRVRVVRNFSLDHTGDVPARGDGDGVTAIFAGNLGRYQDLPLLVAGVGAALARRPKLRLVLMGDGVAKDRLMAEWGAHPQIAFLPFQPFDDARPHIAAADIGLVSLAPGMTRVAYPSKIETYLSLHLPVLALIDAESDMAAQIDAEGFGVVPGDRNPEAIARALEEALDRRAEMRRRAAEAAARRAADDIAGQWRDLVAGRGKG